MKPLIDGDILLHEIGWSGEFKDKDTEEEVLFDFNKVIEILEDKIRLICGEVGATQPPTIYLTNSPTLNDQLNMFKRWQGEPEQEYVPNFRYEVAKTKPYKGTRKNPKPFHFYNLTHYILSRYDTIVSDSGLEADDMVCIDQTEDTIICSRDKDLNICPGWHYSWECGKQRSTGPVYTDKIGWLELTEGKSKKVVGYGLSFFYYQMLVGDSADNIPGLKGWGLVGAYNLLHDLKTEEELFKAVKQAYLDTLGKDEAKDYFLEQANLLWMIQEKGKSFELPN